jgi:hypothetical protein
MDEGAWMKKNQMDEKSGWKKTNQGKSDKSPSRYQ